MSEAWAVQLGLSAHEETSLRSAPMFRGLGDLALQALLEGAAVIGLEQGATLFVQDEPAKRFFLLLDGWVKLYRLREDGEETIVGVIARGETFAEAASFASARYPVCADAVTAARLVGMTTSAFQQAIAADGTIALRMLASLSHRLRGLVGQIENLQAKSAAQRLGAFLVGLCATISGPADLALPLPKALIAQRLGMRPETFSRALLALRAQGVERRGNVITIADVAALARFSGIGGARGCS